MIIEPDQDQEPNYVAETDEIKSQLHRDEWFRTKTEEAKKIGCTFFRFSVDLESTNKAIVEAWKIPPYDQGEIRWHASSWNHKT